MVKRYAPAVERFWFRVNRSAGVDACWIWIGARDVKGYGTFCMEGRRDSPTIGAHRAVWILTNGPIPVGLFVCHRCDNPPCVNPAHLWLGTNNENMADMARKGRAQGHPGHHDAAPKLTPEDVVGIRRRIVEGVGATSIGREFGVSPSMIYRIKLLKSWAHVPLTP